MKKIGLLLFILIDLLVLGASAAFLYWHLNGGSGLPPAYPLPAKLTPRVPVAAKPPVRPATGFSLLTPTTSTVQIPAATVSMSTSSAGLAPGVRHIQFSYRNPKSKQVAIRADFTGWKAEPMKKDARGIWIYQATLVPGEYAYCYTADDKTFRDPANKRTKQIGRTFVSAIVVEPLSAKPSH